MVAIVKYRPNKYSKSAEFRINRRIVQEYGLQEAKNIGALDSLIEEKQKHKNLKQSKKKQYKKQKLQEKQKSQKSGLHTGTEYEEKYKQFIANGGDPNSCPFD
jgi:hypothetical protein